ncbi:MAG TPA: DUF1800 domain-containing protein [Acidimicrobiales bacterium]|nr:DUF1800 domain-containing protein [Acidimicrobiales bacterium]
MTDHSTDSAGPSRRKLLGLAGAGVGSVTAAAWAFTKGPFRSDATLTVGPPPPKLVSRPAAHRASEAGGFASRDASYAAGTPEVAVADATLFATASEAAAATKVTTPTILATDDPALHLLRRATFGPTPALVDEVHAKGIDAWLAEQLDPQSIPDDEAEGVWGQFPLAGMSPDEVVRSIDQYTWDAMFAYGQATLGRQIWSQRQLFEVMVDFWANHLNVATPSGAGWDAGPSYHNDVIRPHALGSFTDMLLAAMRHPAMLKYLSNDLSDKDSVNENLGRELLELHTVGVASGYTEDDVRNSAYILTGRSVNTSEMMSDMEMGGSGAAFAFVAEKHWIDPVTVLDFTHPNPTREGGLEVGDAYLRYLASHPSTAHGIARKLAVRLVADAPSDVLVERMAQAYLDSGTEVKPMLDVLFRSGELWAAVGQKVRRPLENVVASARAVGVRPGADTAKAVEALYWYANQMGQRPLAWPSPDGYPDVRQAWRSTSALLHGWNLHRSLVQGWQEGLTYPAPVELVAGRPAATVGEYVDSLCNRLCLQGFGAEHRNALLAFVGKDPAAPTAGSGLDDPNGMAQHLAPLILDSPYFSLR